MKVLILSDGEDNGGVGAALKFAFDRYAPGWEVRAVRRRNNFINFPVDIEVRDWVDVLPLFEKADLVHMMDKFSSIEWAPGWDKKPRLMHHHGLVFNAKTAPAISKRCRDEGILQITALPGLIQYAPEVRWLPNPCDVDQMMAIRKNNWRPSAKPRVSQTPAQRAPNATDTFLSAFEAVRSRADLMLIEHVSWKTCLAIKSQADIMFDSFISGYGLAGMEAMAMGIPLISGGDAWTESRIQVEIGYLPYYRASPDSLADKMADMVDSSELRQMYGELGYHFAKIVHDQWGVVERLKRIYTEALEGEHGG
jgi:hypothetical protein